MHCICSLLRCLTHSMLLLQVLRALAQQPALQGTQLIAFEQFCCHDTLSDLRRVPKDLWPSLHRVNTHTYTSKHFFQHPLKLLLLWQVRCAAAV